MKDANLMNTRKSFNGVVLHIFWFLLLRMCDRKTLVSFSVYSQKVMLMFPVCSLDGVQGEF